MTDVEKIVELRNALAWMLDECRTTTTEFPAVDTERDAMKNAEHVLRRVGMGDDYTPVRHSKER